MSFIAFECMAKRTNIGYVHANSFHRVYQTHLLKQFIFVAVAFFLANASKIINEDTKEQVELLHWKLRPTTPYHVHMYIYLESLIDFCVHSNKRMNE